MSAQVLGWIGNALFLLGAIDIAKRKSRGFLLQAAGNALYVVYAWMGGAPALLVLSAVLGFISVVGYAFPPRAASGAPDDRQWGRS